jgi:SulP family sulfate permease
MDLAVAVVVGVVVSSLIFSWNSGNTLTVDRYVVKEEGAGDDAEAMVVYEVSGSLFFASTQPFLDSFSERDDPKHVKVKFDNCDIYDWSAIEAINGINQKYLDLEKKCEFEKIKLSSRKIMAKAKALLKDQVSIATFGEGEEIVATAPNKIGSGWASRDSKSD